jgi:hypothetical protein
LQKTKPLSDFENHTAGIKVTPFANFKHLGIVYRPRLYFPSGSYLGSIARVVGGD